MKTEAHMKNKKTCVGMIVLQAVMRLAFMVFLYLALTGTQTVLFAVLAAAVLLLGLMPGRFALGRLFGGDAAKAGYGKRVFQGLVRFFHGIVFFVPLIALAAAMVNVLTNMPFNKAGQILQKFSFLVFSAPSADTGLMGLMVVFLLLGLLAAWGWRRQQAMEYVPDTALLSSGELLKKTAAVRKEKRGMLAGVTVVNVLIALPGLAIFAAVMVPYVWSQLSMASGNLMMMVQLALAMLNKPLPAGQLALLAAAYIVIYVPLHAVRKMRIAKAVRK